MSPEKQRIAIAEACGWRDCFLDAQGFPFGGEPNEPYVRLLPDYLHSLDAMHEAEKVLTSAQHISYWSFLAEMDDYRKCGKSILCATAAQRAEAFLKTLCKWEE